MLVQKRNYKTRLTMYDYCCYISYIQLRYPLNLFII